MTSLRHLFFFLSLGLIWGFSPTQNKYLATVNMPISHTLVITGLGVGVILWGIVRLRQGSFHIAWAMQRYGAACAFLMNLPFALHLYLARHLPPTELALIITTSPFLSYFAAWVTGWESTNRRKLMAIAFGFLSTLVLIVSRAGGLAGGFSWWLVAALGIPVLYSAYNLYAARASPPDADAIQAATTESVWSGLLAVPLMFFAAPFDGAAMPPMTGYLVLCAIVLAWVLERVAFFTLIQEKGAVYTGQATYVATPTAVIIAILFFGGGKDVWLWVSLALLMAALYLNNTGRKTG